MKKALSLLLTLSLILSISIPVLAYEQTPLPNDAIALQYNGHGEFVITTSTSRNIKNDVDNLNTGDTVFAEATNDSDIYRIKGDTYLTQVYGDTYLLSDRVDINIENMEENSGVFNKYSIADSSIEEMKMVIACQKERGNDEFTIELYAPSTIAADVATERGTTTTFCTYTDRYGYTWLIRDTFVKYSNLASKMVEKLGSKSKPSASAFTDVLISAAGTASKTIAVFGIGKSLYDLYVAIRGPVVSSSGSDQTHSLIVFDRIEKTTEVFSDAVMEYLYSKISHKVWLNRLDTYQFYGATGYSELIKPSINTVHYSQYYDDLEAAAMVRPGWEYYINSKLYDTVVVLNGRN